MVGTDDWQVTRLGADERLAQIKRIAGSEQVIVPGADHFFEGRQAALARAVADFLGRVFKPATPGSTR